MFSCGVRPVNLDRTLSFTIRDLSRAAWRLLATGLVGSGGVGDEGCVDVVSSMLVSRNKLCSTSNVEEMKRNQLHATNTWSRTTSNTRLLLLGSTPPDTEHLEH